MKGFKKLILPVLCLGAATLPNQASAEWTTYGLAQGFSRMVAKDDACEYRLRGVSYEANSLTQFYLQFEADVKTAAANGSITTTLRFSTPQSVRFQFTPLVPANGTLTVGGKNYATSEDRADYSSYVEESNTLPYNCSLVLNNYAGNIIPVLNCTRVKSDVRTSLSFLVLPANLVIQEECN